METGLEIVGAPGKFSYSGSTRNSFDLRLLRTLRPLRPLIPCKPLGLLRPLDPLGVNICMMTMTTICMNV